MEMDQEPQLEPELAFFAGDPEKQGQFEKVFKALMPYVGLNQPKLILAQVMVVLKLEQLVGKQMTDQDIDMIRVIKDSILEQPEKKQQSLKFIQRLLN